MFFGAIEIFSVQFSFSRNYTVNTVKTAVVGGALSKKHVGGMETMIHFFSLSGNQKQASISIVLRCILYLLRVSIAITTFNMHITLSYYPNIVQP